MNLFVVHFCNNLQFYFLIALITSKTKQQIWKEYLAIKDTTTIRRPSMYANKIECLDEKLTMSPSRQGTRNSLVTPGTQTDMFL